jgi:propionate CoA-transferase
LRAIGRRVSTVANYDGFELEQSISDAYFSMVSYIQNRYYKSASRYTKNAFMRLRLLSALSERELGEAVFETSGEAERDRASRLDDAAAGTG